MTGFQVLPDVELMLVQYLKTHATLTALVGQRIYTAIPQGPTYPILVVARIGGPGHGFRQHLDIARIQLDAYANTKFSAQQVARAAELAVSDMGGSYAQGVTTAGEIVAGLRWLPDPEVDAKPRYTFDALIYVHP